MKVRGDLSPSAAFTIEVQPNKPSFVLARFYENVSAFSEEREGETMNGYEYDEYHLELFNTGALAIDIEANYEQYLAAAKDLEAPGAEEQIQHLNEQNEMLKNAVVELTLLALGESSDMEELTSLITQRVSVGLMSGDNVPVQIKQRVDNALQPALT
jgi:hypothetical protein